MDNLLFTCYYGNVAQKKWIYNKKFVNKTHNIDCVLSLHFFLL